MEVTKDGTIIADTPGDIAVFRMLALRGRLELEVKGLRFRLPTAPAVREIMGSRTRSKAQLLVEYESWLREQGILRD